MRNIGTKYQTKQSIYKANGELVPDDEPVLMFRAQDKLTPLVLEQYRKLLKENNPDSQALQQLDEEIDKIKKWQKTNYTRYPK